MGHSHAWVAENSLICHYCFGSEQDNAHGYFECDRQTKEDQMGIVRNE